MLDSVTEVRGSVQISFNPLLTGLGFASLETIGGDLGIENEVALPSFAGFEHLSSVGGQLSIRSNSALGSISGLGQVTAAGSALDSGFVFIRDNPLLPECEVDAFRAQLVNFAGYFSSYGNGSGSCN